MHCHQRKRMTFVSYYYVAVDRPGRDQPNPYIYVAVVRPGRDQPNPYIYGAVVRVFTSNL